MINEHTTLEQLQLELWDFFKDVHGMRPRHWTAQEWESREFLLREHEALCRFVDAMTPEQKIAEGWGSDAGYLFDEVEND